MCCRLYEYVMSCCCCAGEYVTLVRVYLYMCAYNIRVCIYCGLSRLFSQWAHPSMPRPTGPFIDILCMHTISEYVYIVVSHVSFHSEHIYTSRVAHVFLSFDTQSVYTCVYIHVHMSLSMCTEMIYINTFPQTFVLLHACSATVRLVHSWAERQRQMCIF